MVPRLAWGLSVRSCDRPRGGEVGLEPCREAEPGTSTEYSRGLPGGAGRRATRRLSGFPSRRLISSARQRLPFVGPVPPDASERPVGSVRLRAPRISRKNSVLAPPSTAAHSRLIFGLARYRAAISLRTCSEDRHRPARSHAPALRLSLKKSLENFSGTC